MKHIILGIKGQIGSCIQKFLNEVNVTDTVGIEKNKEVVCGNFEGNDPKVIHVCIPFVDASIFCNVVNEYIKEYNPIYVIVYSTVLPGTCNSLGQNVVHSPVEGRHPNLFEGFKTFKRIVAGKCSKEVGKLFTDWGLNVITFDDAATTELGKLLSTTRYGLNILFANVENTLCNEIGVKFEDVVFEYQKMYNEGYKKLGEERFIQPLLSPPNEKIGGHCIVENAKLLKVIVNNQWVKDLSEYNDKFKKTN